MQAFVRERGVVHPREVDAAFAHGKTRNWFGGVSNASTQLLDGMHYRGLLRVARREGGVRLYAAHDAHRRESAEPDAALDAMVDVAVGVYAPLPAPTLSMLVMWLGSVTAAQWRDRRAAALERAKARLPSATIDGQRWYWPAGENPASRRHASGDDVRLLAPFDPLVWDRRRFALLWGWEYRLEAYTPAPKRLRGYYALPLLWRDQVIGWGNLTQRDGGIQAEIGYVAAKAPRDAGFRRALDDELGRIEQFLQPR